MNSKKLFAIILAITVTSVLISSSVEAQTTGKFTEWNGIATTQADGSPSPVRDFNPHITDLDKTGNTGFTSNTPWYTIDNRSPGPPCALGHLEPSTNTLISWGIGFGVPVGIDVDDASGRIWWTVRGSITGVSGAHVAFKFPGAAVNTFRHFPSTGNAAGITLDAAGNAYFAELDFPDGIVRVTPSGSIKRWPLPSPSNQEPRYLGFDSSGDNLYFTTANSRTINRLNITTNVLTTWAYPTTASSSFSILDAYGLFVQNDEAIWYADTRGNKVARLNPSTNVITEFTKAGMNQPAFIVLSPDRVLLQAFISERFGNTIDALDIGAGGGVDNIITPTTTTLSPSELIVTPVDFDRTPLSRVITPVVTNVTGVDPPGIIRFSVPTAASQPIGITDVVETAISPTATTAGIFGDSFSFPVSKIFLFESLVIIPPVEDVQLDIKPQSCPNPLNVKTKGVLPVAILGSQNLDVNDIDVSTVQLEGVSPLGSDIEDVSTPVANRLDECDCTTEGADGFDDLTLKFDTQTIIAALGPVNDGDEIVLTLVGRLADGTPIIGQDCVIIKAKGLRKSVAEAEKRIPENYALFQNHPNPFNPETEIRFQLPEASRVILRIFNTVGQEIRTLANTQYEAGFHSVRWDSKDNGGNSVSSGVYLYQLQAGNFTQVKKMSLLR